MDREDRSAPPILEYGFHDSILKDANTRRLLKALVLAALGLSLSYLLVLPRSLPGFFLDGAAALLTLASGLISLPLLQRGRYGAVAQLLVWGTWGALLSHLFMINGLASHSLMGFPVLILLAGWLLSARSAGLMGLLSLLAGGLLYQGELVGVLPLSKTPPGAHLGLLAYAIFIVFAMIVAHFVFHGFRRRHRLLRRLGLALQDQVKTLGEREVELGLLMENIPAFVFHADRELRCRYANRRHAEFFGFTPQTILGRHLSEILGEAGLEALQPRLKAVLAGKTVHYQSTRRSALDGQDHVLDITFVPEFDFSGAVSGFYALKRDITEEMRAQQALKEQHAFQETLMQAQSDAGLALFLLEGERFIQANGAASRLTGYAVKELLELPSFLELVPAEDREWVVEDHRLRLAGRPRPRAQRIALLTRDGERRDAELSTVPLPDGSGRLLIVMTDVSDRQQMEERLIQSERKFSRIFHNSLVSITLSRLDDGRFIDVNPAFLQLMGWTREEVIGRTSEELGIWPSALGLREWFSFIRESGRMDGREVQVVDKNGRLLDVLFSVETIELEGEPCLLVLATDLTQLKTATRALEENEKRLREAQRIGHFGSWEMDMQGNHMHFSAELHDIIERPASEFHSSWSRFLDSVHPADVAILRDARRRIDGGENHLMIRHRILTPEGRVKCLQVRFEVSRDATGQALRMQGTTQDITDLVLAHEEIRRLNAELERRVEQRTAELSAANRELETFAYSISHDLRTPLRAIDGFSHLLAVDYAERLDQTGADYLDRVRRAAQRMGELIDDILELSRLTRLEMQRQAVDLSAIAHILIEEHRRVEPTRRVEVRIEPGCSVEGDPQLLGVLMQNLIDNAWKYTRKTPAARIAFGKKVSAGKTAFYVADNGVGFDMGYADRLFRPFQRLHRPEEFEGTGVGLATVGRIVQRHGGRVWAESRLGEGAAFYFAFPPAAHRQDAR